MRKAPHPNRIKGVMPVQSARLIHQKSIGVPSNDLYNVIVVGGGPGGATAAYYLGESGRRVLVLEKELFPRYKACGGATSLRLLEEFPFDFGPEIASSVKAVTLAYLGESVTLDLPESPIQMTMRADLDTFLLNHARAEVRQGDAIKSVEKSLLRRGEASHC